MFSIQHFIKTGVCFTMSDSEKCEKIKNNKVEPYQKTEERVYVWSSSFDGAFLELEPWVDLERLLRAISIVVKQLGSTWNVFFCVNDESDRINRVLHI